MTRGVDSLTPEIEQRIRRLRKQNGYSVQGIAQRLNVSRKAVSGALRSDLTPLNIRTTRKYLRCQENGGCVPSKVYVVRHFQMGYLAIPECRRCKVPIRSRSRGMNWNYFDATKGAA